MSFDQADRIRILRVGASILNHPAHRALSFHVRDAINADPKNSMDLLASHLAYAYAQGLVRGWRAREQHRGDELPELPPEILE